MAGLSGILDDGRSCGQQVEAARSDDTQQEHELAQYTVVPTQFERIYSPKAIARPPATLLRVKPEYWEFLVGGYVDLNAMLQQSMHERKK